jgi:hypothetical protein
MCTGCCGSCLQHSSGYYLYSPNLCHGWLWVEGRQVLLLPVLSLCMLHLLFTVWRNVDCMHPITNVGKYSCFFQPHWLEHFCWIPCTPTGKHISDLSPRQTHDTSHVLSSCYMSENTLVPAVYSCLVAMVLLDGPSVLDHLWHHCIAVWRHGPQGQCSRQRHWHCGEGFSERQSGLQARFHRIRRARAFLLYHFFRPPLHLRHEGLELPETVEGDQNVCVWLGVYSIIQPCIASQMPFYFI